VRHIFADASDINRVVVRCLGGGRRIPARLALVDHRHARGLLQQLPRLGLGQLAAGLDVTASECPKNTGTRTAVAFTRMVVAHDLLGLPEHLHLFLRVAVVQELVDLRHDS
jgi:hypothetical protein